jgi:hypothetical protein
MSEQPLFEMLALLASAGVVGLFGWIIRISGTMLTRAEHQGICDRNNLRIVERLRSLEASANTAEVKREEIQRELAAVASDVKLLLKLPPSSATIVNVREPK